MNPQLVQKILPRPRAPFTIPFVLTLIQPVEGRDQ